MIKKLLILPVLGLVTMGLVVAPLKASAVTGADWQAGNIADDIVFTNKNAMSVNEIQTFLNQNVGTTLANGTPGVCDTNGVKMSEFGGGTRAQYGAAHGNPAPFTCLKDYYEVPKTSPSPGMPANNYGGKPIPAGAESAAQLIWDAAQQYGISPKVLLVTIKKESVGPLTSDDWPTLSQYQHPLGAHCPDNGPGGAPNCDPNYFGFSIQVSEAAALFRYYLDNMTQPWWPYKKLGVNSILYSPTSGCGSSNVNILTSATAALYTYTPYQPNQAALNNLYGTGDGCSSYGNRNFWRYFSDWFGAPNAPEFGWQNMGMVIEDENKNAEIPTDNMHSGERLYVQVTAKNTGTTTWSNSGDFPVRLATVRPNNSYTPYCDTTWTLLCDRPATLQEASVGPGQIGHFNFYMAVPNTMGQYRYYFAPVAEYKSWMRNDEGFNIYVNNDGGYEWQWLYFDAYTDSSKTTPADMDHVARGQQIYIVMHVRNMSATVWSNSGPNPARFGTSHPLDQQSPLCANTWISCNRAGTLDQATLAPGQEGTFSFYIKAPNNFGVYRQYMQPVLEYKGWARNDTNYIYLNVTK